MTDWSKVGKKSRNKGATYERRIAHILSEWWTHGESKKAFRRTVMSGGWDKRFAAGDLLAPIPDFPFHIEIRKRQEFGLCSLLKGAAPMKWWLDGIEEKLPGKRLIYVMSRNGELDYLVLDWRTWSAIQNSLESSQSRANVPYYILHGHGVRLVIMVLQNLLENFSVDEFTRIFVKSQEG